MNADLSPAFNEIQVFNRDGERVDSGNARLTDSRTVEVALDPLDAGTYTVAWQTTSAADAHRSTGTFRFTVSGGGRIFLGSGAAYPDAGDQTGPTVANTLARWGELLGLALVGGGLLSLAVVWMPALARSEDGDLLHRRTGLRLLVPIGLAMATTAIAWDLFLQASSIADLNGEARFDALYDVLARSPTGLRFVIRIALLAGVAAFWYRWDRTARGDRRILLCVSLCLAGLAILGRSFGSHAATADGNLLAFSIAFDYVHLVAASVWIGGLVGVLASVGLLRELSRDALSEIVSRFSNVAIVSVALIAVTGLYNAWLEVGTLGALFSTSYGKLIVLKTVLLAPLLALGALNLIGVRPRLRNGHTEERRTRRMFGAVVRWRWHWESRCCWWPRCWETCRSGATLRLGPHWPLRRLWPCRCRFRHPV